MVCFVVLQSVAPFTDQVGTWAGINKILSENVLGRIK